MTCPTCHHTLILIYENGLRIWYCTACGHKEIEET